METFESTGEKSAKSSIDEIVDEVEKSESRPVNKERFAQIANMQNDLLDTSKQITETMKSLKPLLKQGIDIREQFQKLGLVQ